MTQKQEFVTGELQRCTTIEFEADRSAALYAEFLKTIVPWGANPTPLYTELGKPGVIVDLHDCMSLDRWFDKVRKEGIWEWANCFEGIAVQGQYYLKMKDSVRSVFKHILCGLNYHNKNMWYNAKLQMSIKSLKDLGIFVRTDHKAIVICPNLIDLDESKDRHYNIIREEMLGFNKLVELIVESCPKPTRPRGRLACQFDEYGYDYQMYKELHSVFAKDEKKQHFATLGHIINYQEYVASGPLCWDRRDILNLVEMIDYIDHMIFHGLYTNKKYDVFPIYKGVASLVTWHDTIFTPSGDFKRDLHDKSVNNPGNVKSYPVFFYYKNNLLTYKKHSEKEAHAANLIRFIRNAREHVTDSNLCNESADLFTRIMIVHANLPKVLPVLHYAIISTLGNERIYKSTFYEAFCNIKNKHSTSVVGVHGKKKLDVLNAINRQANT